MYVYHTVYQAIDAEEYGGVWELVKEGMMGSFALFLVGAPPPLSLSLSLSLFLYVLFQLIYTQMHTYAGMLDLDIQQFTLLMAYRPSLGSIIDL